MKKLVFFFAIFTVFLSFLLGITLKNKDLKDCSLRNNLRREFSLYPIFTGKFNLKAKGIKDGDLIVGAINPNENLTISGNKIITGNIIVINSGSLIFENARITLYGNIFVTDSGNLEFHNSYLTVMSKFRYSNGLLLVKNSRVTFDNSNVDTNGGIWAVTLMDTSELLLNNTFFKYGVTTGLKNNSRCVSDGSNPFEWVIMDNSYLEVKNSDGPFIFWPTFGNGSIAEVSFPEGNSVSSFEISDDISGMSGVGFCLKLKDVRNVLWGLMVKGGANVVVKNSTMKSTAIYVGGDGNWNINGITNGRSFKDDVIPVDGINLRYVNSSVEIFNVYCQGNTNVKISNCVLGEIGMLENSSVTVKNTLVDGSGGLIFSSDSSYTTFDKTSCLSDVISNLNSTQIYINSSILGWHLAARDESSILLFDSSSDAIPEAYESGIVLLESISPHTGGTVDNIVPIYGSVYVVSGEKNPLEFKDYGVSFGKGINPDAFLPILDSSNKMVKNGIIAFWNTEGLSPGYYTVKISLRLTGREPFNVVGYVYLGEKSNLNSLRIIPFISGGNEYSTSLLFDNNTDFFQQVRLYTFDGKNLVEDRYFRLKPLTQSKIDLDGHWGVVVCPQSVHVRESIVEKNGDRIGLLLLKNFLGKQINFPVGMAFSQNIKFRKVIFLNPNEYNLDISGKIFLEDGENKIFNVTLPPFSLEIKNFEELSGGIDWNYISSLKCNSDNFFSGILFSGDIYGNLFLESNFRGNRDGDLFLPLFLLDNGWNSFIEMTNFSGVGNSVNFKLFSGGESIYTSSFYLSGNSKKEVNLNFYSSLNPQYAVIEGSQGDISVKASFISQNGAFCDFPLPEEGEKRMVFLFPNVFKEFFNWSLMSIVNTSTDRADVNLLVYSSGKLLAEKEVSIEGNSNYIGFFHDIFPSLNDYMADRVIVKASSPLCGTIFCGFGDSFLISSNGIPY